MKVLPLVLALGWLGCGYDSSYTGMGDRAVTGFDPPPTCRCDCAGEGEGEGEGELLVEDLTARGFRFDSLALTAPLTGFMADQLNGYFSDQIASGDLNVLLLVTRDDRGSGGLDLLVGAGSSSEGGGYRFDGDPGGLVCALDRARFTTTEPGSLDFPAGLLSPPELPLRSLGLEGRFTPEGDAIEDGKLQGGLSRQDAEQVALGATTFAAMLDSMEIQEDWDSDGDGVMDGWLFEGAFTAGAAQVQALAD